MNAYFYKLWLPTVLLSIVVIPFATINWYLVFLCWFLIGPIGTGVGLHRLFAHRQFETYRPLEILIAILGTLSAYGPILYWVSQHQHHHKHADAEEDINSPIKGFWHSFFYWRFTEAATKKIHVKNYCTIRAAKDPVIVFLSKHFIVINLAVIVLLYFISIDLLVTMYLLPVLIEQLRVNVLNSLAHMKLPGSYRIAESKDNSYNNIVLGYLTLGFGWHNAHHANPRELVNSHRWWEIDIEGLVGKLISKK
jgi:stearoyl-CoA desaturase (delta-9 desaturase)